MILNENKCYVMQYEPVGKGCPSSLVGFFNCDSYEWSPYEMHPEALSIRKQYRLALSDLEIDLDLLDFDFYQLGSTYVSRNFLEVCDALKVKYRAVPLEISLKGRVAAGEYFIFLPGESLSALDTSLSVYEVAKDLETGAVIQSPLYPGAVSISKIDLFVLTDSVDSDVFRCQETLQLLCSERFKHAASLLKGISFLPVDENYRYDPWAELDDL